MPRKLSSETLTAAQLEELAAIGLSDTEICNLLGISESRWKARYPSVIKKGRARLRKSLRRAQIKSALSGNSTMLVWLGKQYLGQSDRLDHSVSAEHKVISITPNVFERLHTSYRRYDGASARPRGALQDAQAPAREKEAGGPLGDPGGLSKTAPLLANSDSETSDKCGPGEL